MSVSHFRVREPPLSLDSIILFTSPFSSTPIVTPEDRKERQCLSRKGSGNTQGKGGVFSHGGSGNMQGKGGGV